MSAEVPNQCLTSWQHYVVNCHSLSVLHSHGHWLSNPLLVLCMGSSHQRTPRFALCSDEEHGGQHSDDEEDDDVDDQGELVRVCLGFLLVGS